ncbi:hypothetical protein FDP41_006439 [Naegleria fowleri]|uniref:Protein kinase domain-containing protein n=1 Tax=Naegleria fowleri TaxID=5763 RepID=A0A6A5BB72_NAEFO|nr:uncharacterized protein FDP41_006439 [Naegleria fowleri]KAF0974407.1 hypothetical protein FDP41_006439 [Naegleria fowleri]CAG4710319.1 unnamed protein product [Naegleria fowleri]
MVKIATNHHTVKAKSISSSSSDGKASSNNNNKNSTIYDENDHEWITQHNPLFDCNFATLLEITDGVLRPPWATTTTTTTTTSSHHPSPNQHTFRMPSYWKTTSSSSSSGCSKPRKRRGSSILALAQPPHVPSPGSGGVAKMEFEFNWQVQEHFMAKFESVERMSRKPPHSSLYQVKYSEHDSTTRRVLRLIQAENAIHAKQLVDTMEKIRSMTNSHECFVQIYDVCLVGENTVAIEMEYIELGDLQTFLEEEGLFLSDEMVQQVIAQVCHALQHLPEKQLHGHIRPHNILIRSFNDDENEIKIALSDFGWKSPSLTRSSRDKRFVIPSKKISTLCETFSETRSSDNNNNVDHKIAGEIFHLGVTLYQLCSRDKEVILSQLYEQQDLDEISVREALAARLTKHYQYKTEVVDVILRMISPNNFDLLSVNDLLSNLNMVRSL